MGWWSATVLGGDSPCDVADEFKCIALGENANQLFDDMYDEKLTHDQLDKMIRDGMIANFDELTTAGLYIEEEIRHQVYGLMMMEYGMPADDPRVIKILKDARHAAKHDEWAQDDYERKDFMDEFIKQIDDYDGTASYAKHEGLFEKLADVLESGKILNSPRNVD